MGVLNLFYQIECMLPINCMFRWLEAVAQSLDISSVVFGQKAWDIAETKWRARDDLDIVDRCKYAYARKMRNLKYYYNYCMVGFSTLAWETLRFTMIFRLACIWFNLSP